MVAPSAYSCGGVGDSKICDGDAAAQFAHAMALVGAPSAYCCGGAPIVYCGGSVEDPRRCDGDC